MKKFKEILKDGANEAVSSVDQGLGKKNAKPEGKGKKRRRLMFKVMFVASILSIMVSVTYSWFTSSDTAKVQNMSMYVVDPKNLEAADISANGVLNSVAGDGTNFFSHELEEVLIETDSEGFAVYGYDKKIGGSYSKTGDDVTSNTAVLKNVRVVDFSLKMSGDAETICLSNGTKLSAATGSPEYLSGALRVTVLKRNAVSGKYEPLLIWIPDISSSKSGTEGDELSYTFVTADGSEKQFNVNGETGSQEVDGITYAWGPVDENRQIDIDTISGMNQYRFVIWLDGNDREAGNELIGQKYVANFNITPKNS